MKLPARAGRYGASRCQCCASTPLMTPSLHSMVRLNSPIPSQYTVLLGDLVLTGCLAFLQHYQWRQLVLCLLWPCW